MSGRRREPPTEPPRQAAVTRRLRELKKPMVDFTADLCAIATVNPPGERYLDCCRFLADKLDAMGFKTRLVRVPRRVQERHLPKSSRAYPRVSVLARWDVGAHRTLHITGHYDVVPPTTAWRGDPFRPVLRGGRLVARGAQDMKASIAAALFALQALRDTGVAPAWNIEVSFTPDEETGGALGLGYLVKSGLVRPDAAILCEGGSGNTIGYAHKGVLWLDVTVRGKAGHASHPASGVNALEGACAVIRRLKLLERSYARRATAFKMNRPSLKHPTLMMGGMAGGGGKVNTIPDTFHFTIDRRLNPEERMVEARREIVAAVQAAVRPRKGLRARVKTLLYVPPGWTDPDGWFSRLARDAFRSVAGRNPRFRMTPGFTDMHWLSQDVGAPVVMHGTTGAGAHADREYVLLSSIPRTAAFYAAVVLRMPPETAPPSGNSNISQGVCP